MKRYLPFLIIGLVVAIAGIAAWLMMSAGQPGPSTTMTLSTPAPEASAAPGASPTATPAPTPTIVAKSKLVTIEEFGDYQCPPCGGLHPILNSLKKEFGDRMQVKFYHFPLSQIHKNALSAAMTSVAAALQGKFGPMHDLLYDSQKEWSEVDNFAPFAFEYARRVGLDLERFKQDVNNPMVRQQIASDMKRGESMKVDSTPTLFIDNLMIPNEKYTLEDLRKEIDMRLIPKK